MASQILSFSADLRCAYGNTHWSMLLSMGHVKQNSFQSGSSSLSLLFFSTLITVMALVSALIIGLRNVNTFVVNFHHAPTLTWSIFDTSLSILDLSASTSGLKLMANVHNKPTNFHSHLDYNLSHPVGTQFHSPSFPPLLHMLRNKTHGSLQHMSLYP